MPRVVYNKDLLLGQLYPTTFRYESLYNGIASEVNSMLRGIISHNDDIGKYWKFQLSKGTTVEDYGCFVVSLYNAIVSSTPEADWMQDFDLYLAALATGDYSLDGVAELFNDDGELVIDTAMHWLLGADPDYSVRRYNTWQEFEKSTDYSEFLSSSRGYNIRNSFCAIISTTARRTPNGVILNQPNHAMTLLAIKDGEYSVYDPWRIDPQIESEEPFLYEGKTYVPWATINPRKSEHSVGAITVVQYKQRGFRDRWRLPLTNAGSIASRLRLESVECVTNMFEQTFGKTFAEALKGAQAEVLKILNTQVVGDAVFTTPYWGAEVRKEAFSVLPILQTVVDPETALMIKESLPLVRKLDYAINALTAIYEFAGNNPITWFVGGIAAGGITGFVKFIVKRKLGKKMAGALIKKYMKRSSKTNPSKGGSVELKKDGKPRS